MSLPGSFVVTPAGRVFVHRAGRGEPLVLLHGWMMSHWYFRRILDVLAEEREVIAIDLPGYGESDRPSPDAYTYDLPTLAATVHEVLGRLGIARADLLGHSMGGGVALTLAARHPERVQRLALISPAIYPRRVDHWEIRLALLPGIGGTLFKRVFSRRDFGRGVRTLSVRDAGAVDDELIDYFWARLCRAGGKEAAYACLRMLASLPEHSGDPGRVRAPTLLIWGDEDRLVPLPNGKRLSRAIAGARLEIVPASGHSPFLERPDEFLRVLAPFLRAPAAPLVETPIPPRRAHSVGR